VHIQLNKKKKKNLACAASLPMGTALFCYALNSLDDDRLVMKLSFETSRTRHVVICGGQPPTDVTVKVRM
jgi:hypothetical protein